MHLTASKCIIKGDYRPNGEAGARWFNSVSLQISRIKWKTNQQNAPETHELLALLELQWKLRQKLGQKLPVLMGVKVNKKYVYLS